MAGTEEHLPPSAGEPIVDSIRRLVSEAADGRRSSFDDLAAAMFAVVTDSGLAGQAMDVMAAAPTLWIELDVAVRRRYPLFPACACRPHGPLAAVPEGCQSLGRVPDGSAEPGSRGGTSPEPSSTSLAVALAACARDGRERERAVRHPAMRTDAGLLPVLVMRSTDWVRPVRDRAVAVLGEVLAGAVDATAFLAAVPVVAGLEDRARVLPALELVRDALARADDETLDLVRRCPDRSGRRFVYDVALRAGRLDHGRLASAAMHESDQVSRTRCARALAAQAIEHDRPELVLSILDGTSAQGRVEALTALVRLGGTEHGLRFLADSAGMVRLTAQWAVRRAGGDPAELYRERIKTDQRVVGGRATRGLLAGIGDCGTRDDAALVLPYLRDSRPRVRAEAVRTLRRLGAVEAGVAALLEDPAPMVVRNVVITLRDSFPSVPIERLWTLLGAGHPRHVRLGAHRLLIHRGNWSRVRADLLLVHDRDETVSRRACVDLTAWCRRDSASQYLPPPPADLRQELERLAGAAEGVLSARNMRVLRWMLGSAG
ncbi:hypothetical protein [Nonomuraea insulae]|uniref:HEAT repeat protein n=1 Tax=Nonomuraea insulae TaxID=1616787 RepID=A0ABW1CP04_9ACTN